MNERIISGRFPVSRSNSWTFLVARIPLCARMPLKFLPDQDFRVWLFSHGEPVLPFLILMKAELVLSSFIAKRESPTDIYVHENKNLPSFRKLY